MNVWVFGSEAECVAAEAAITSLLQDDRLADGTVAARQVTERWAEPQQLPDGRWLIPAHTSPIPANAVIVATGLGEDAE